MNPEEQQSVKHFASFLLSLPQNEYTALAFVIGLILSQPLTRQEKSSLGNFLMEIAQTMVTIASQQNLLENIHNKNDFL